MALKFVDLDPNWAFSGLYLQLEFTDGYEMMHRARSSIVEVPYCFSRSSVKFQGHTAQKIVEFDPKWAFPDCNSSLNSPMAMKCCTKLETAKERCPIVFQGHPSNFKVTRYKASPILTQIGRFRTIGQSQLSNPSDLPCCLNQAINPHISWTNPYHVGFRYEASLNFHTYFGQCPNDICILLHIPLSCLSKLPAHGANDCHGP